MTTKKRKSDLLLPYAVSAIMPAAGQGKRMRSKTSKAFAVLNGEPIFLWTLKALVEAYPFKRIVVPTRRNNIGMMKKLIKKHGLKGVVLIIGGRTRAESVENGLKYIKEREGLVLVHDMARPLVTKNEIRRVIVSASYSGASILALKSTSTVKETYRSSRKIMRTLDRNNIFLAQTPQVFSTKVLKEAYKKQGANKCNFTDEAGLVEASGCNVNVVSGSSSNIKITTPEDLSIASAVMNKGL